MTHENQEPDPEAERIYQWMMNLAADLTKLVGVKLAEVQADGFNAFDYRYAVMHAHLIGIAGSIYACQTAEEQEEMLVHFAANSFDAVRLNIATPEMWRTAPGFDGPMENHSDD
ncbi:MAG: hypothetical protein ABWY64_21505 [Tardiphaga sp.]